MGKYLNRVVQHVGLIGYGKAGEAVARVIQESADARLKWICRRQPAEGADIDGIPVFDLNDRQACRRWISREQVDFIIDFSSPEALSSYGERAAEQGIGIISANSAHTPEQLALAARLGRKTRVMCAPNITRGVNFLLLAANAVRRLAPDADVAILEEHFRDKAEISGTARRIASTLDVKEESIRSLRLGGVVGSHQVIFGFPYQTLRLTHESISREAFGTGALYAMQLLANQPSGFYAYDQLLLSLLISELQAMQGRQAA